MNKVYVVTSGEYSSYHIDAIFSTRELAELFNESVKAGGADVEEWDLDPVAAELRQGFSCYFGRIDKAGNVTELSSEPRYSFVGTTQHAFDVNGNLYMDFMAKDDDHARKILAERHADVLASGRWPKE